ncbi:MAG: VCBS repeat-containing protein [bacterium]|nr:VCBS repeat-containing protein [bacterium]
MKNMPLMLAALSSLVILTGCGGSLSASSPPSPAVAQVNLGYGQPLVAVSDVNGDDLNDIVFGDKDGVKLLVNIGNGKFAAPVVIGNASLGYGQPSVAIGDVTGDGLADVIFGDKNGVTVLKNLGENRFEVLR